MTTFEVAAGWLDENFAKLVQRKRRPTLLVVNKSEKPDDARMSAE